MHYIILFGSENDSVSVCFLEIVVPSFRHAHEVMVIVCHRTNFCILFNSSSSFIAINLCLRITQWDQVCFFLLFKEPNREMFPRLDFRVSWWWQLRQIPHPHENVLWWDLWNIKFFVWIPFYLQAVQIHSANGVKLLEAWRGVPSSTPPYQ
jgi:hypothetical protein